MISYFDGALLFVLSLFPLIFLQRKLHHEMQAVFILITRREDITIGLFSLIFFPGVFLHEFSHFLAAKLLGVPTGKFSIFPQALPDGRLRMGYVETGRTDPLRDSLIGLAPLISGVAFIAYAATFQMYLTFMWDLLRDGQSELFLKGLQTLPTLPDFWLWFYLVLAVSSTMMPSASDRHGWQTVGIFAGIMLLVGLLAGAGPWLLDNIAAPLNNALKSITFIFGISILFHAILIVPFLLFHILLTKITGLDVVK